MDGLVTEYELVVYVADLLWTCYGEVANFLSTCCGEREFGDYSRQCGQSFSPYYYPTVRYSPLVL